jgi:hypothetical protein
MKKSILVFVILSSIVLTSCKKDTTSSEQSGSQGFNPPSWIIGTWVDQNDAGFHFTTDDIYVVFPNVNEISTLQGIQGRDYEINETTTDSSYEFIITYHDTNSSETWHFNKLSDTQIQYIDNTNSSFTYTKK